MIEDSEWLKFNKFISFRTLNKSYFNKYPFAIELGSAKQNITDYSHSTFYKKSKVKVRNLVEIYNNKFNKDLKTMSCTYTVKVYAECLEDLYDLVEKYVDNAFILCMTVYRPKNAQQLELLKQGYLLTSKESEFPHVLTIRAGYYDSLELTGLANYLSALQEQKEVKVTALALKRLRYAKYYFTGCTISVKDPNLVELIRLSCPKCVGNLKEKVIVTN
jgi:hypothetical protein